MLMSLKQKKRKFEPRIKLNHYIYMYSQEIKSPRWIHDWIHAHVGWKVWVDHLRALGRKLMSCPCSNPKHAGRACKESTGLAQASWNSWPCESIMKTTGLPVNLLPPINQFFKIHNVMIKELKSIRQRGFPLLRIQQMHVHVEVNFLSQVIFISLLFQIH